MCLFIRRSGSSGISATLIDIASIFKIVHYPGTDRDETDLDRNRHPQMRVPVDEGLPGRPFLIECGVDSIDRFPIRRF